LPLLFLLFAWDVGRSRRAGRLSVKALGPWLLSMVLPVLLAGWWYKEAALSGGDTLVSSFGTITPHAVDLFSFLLNYPWKSQFKLWLLLYWGNFGWVDTPMSYPLLRFLVRLTVLTMALMVWWFVKQAFPRRREATGSQIFSFGYLGCATLSLIIFYTYLDYRLARDLGAIFSIQGRYFLPGVIGQMAWGIQGLLLPIPQRFRSAWMWLLGLGMMALNVYALIGVIMPRYYGSGNLLTLLERATVLQPVGVAVPVTIAAIFMLFYFMLLATLWGARGAPACQASREYGRVAP
jgi:hypothetical protein